MTARLTLRLIGTLLLVQACTLEAGNGFATIEGGALRMELEPGRARALDDGGFSTDEGYRIHPERLTLHASEITLLERHAAQDGMSASFDPASPPDGFSNCHGGHCHGGDGSLVDYEDIEAMLAGGAASFEPIATLPIGRTFDLLGGEEVTLHEVMPSPELPQGSIDRIEIGVARLRLTAEVEGGELAQPVMLEIDLSHDESIAGALSVRIDRDGPEQLELAVTLQLDATLLDGVDLAGLARDGRIVVEDEGPIDEAIHEWLANADLSIAL